MTMPPGLDRGNVNIVCKLKQSLYGLKQLPRAWFHRFARIIQIIGYQQGQLDHTLFFKQREDGKKTILIVYMDDIIQIREYLEEIERPKTNLAMQFEIKDLGPIRYFLGKEVARSKKGISVS